MSAIVKRETGTPILAKSWDEAKHVGESLARSGMFGITTAEQGMIVLATCQAEQMSLFDFMRTYHIIEGRPCMRADALLAAFRARGGRYRIIERTATRAALETDFEGAKLTWEFTFADAEKMELTRGKDREPKKNWRTVPKQMLWARAVSDMVRTLCPEIVAGVYTPEETADFTGGTLPAEDVATDAIAVPATVVQDPPAAAPAAPAPAAAKPTPTPATVIENEPSPAPHVPAEEQAKFLALVDKVASTPEKRAAVREWLATNPTMPEFIERLKAVTAKLTAQKDAVYDKMVDAAGDGEPPRYDQVPAGAPAAAPAPSAEPIHTLPTIGTKYDGKPCDGVGEKVLHAFLASKHPDVTPAHRAGIQQALNALAAKGGAK